MGIATRDAHRLICTNDVAITQLGRVTCDTPIHQNRARNWSLSLRRLSFLCFTPSAGHSAKQCFSLQFSLLKMAETETNTRRIVFGVDASEHSVRAFDWFIQNVCNKETDHVMIIHAQEYPTIPAAPYPYGYAYYEEWQHLVEKSDKQVKELLEHFGTKCKGEKLKFKLYKEESNRPGEVICKLASDEKAELIVMGSRGVGTLRRTFLGSVSDYCVHHAHIPVVVVPPLHSHEDHAKSS